MPVKHKPIPYPKDKETALQYFREHGICIQHWAVALGLKPHNVKDVLYQRNRGTRGAGHEAAVALGFKRKPRE